MAIGLGHRKDVTLREILATRAKATFPYRVNFKQVLLANYEDMKLWCEMNCKGLWHSHNVHAIYFQFEDDYDATMFMLRWSGANGNVPV